MCSAFRMSQGVSGRGLYGINRLLFRVTGSRVKKNGEVLTRPKYTDFE